MSCSPQLPTEAINVSACDAWGRPARSTGLLCGMAYAQARQADELALLSALLVFAPRALAAVRIS